MNPRARLLLAALMTAACGGSTSDGGEIPHPKGDPVPKAAADAESAGSEPVPATFRGAATSPTARPPRRPPPTKSSPPAPTSTPM